MSVSRLPLRALLADDERLARKRLRELLGAHPEIEVIGEADGVEGTVAFAARERVDVLFLDVQMPPRCGFDALPALQPLPKVVFVTAHDRFAVRAFEADAFDYLLKPVHPDRLAETVRRLLTASPPLPSPKEESSSGTLQLHDYVTLRDKGTLQMVPVHQIAAIEAEAAYSRVLLSGQESRLVLRPIQEWERMLPAPPFARLDRSLLVNLNRVRSVQVLNRSETHLGLAEVGTPLVLGRAASVRLRKLLV